MTKEEMEAYLEHRRKGVKDGLAAKENSKNGWFYDSQEYKQTAGKLRLNLVPPGTEEAIAEVRGWAAQKYPDPDSWKHAKPEDIIEATDRHWKQFKKYYYWRDHESGLYHLDHAFTNMSFLEWDLHMGLMDALHDDRFPDEKEAEDGQSS